MYQDVVELKAFYESPLGRITARLIRRQITDLWPDMAGIDVMGLGYATPYLDVYRNRAQHVANIMPAAQGVMRWPRHNGNLNKHQDRRDHPYHYNGNLTVLAHEGQLPIRDAAIDRILMVHILEHTEKSRALLREVWRCLAPGGRVIVIVPNRVGFWSRNDHTPFGHGKPFSTLQIRQLLNDNMLTPTRNRTALHLPAFSNRSLLSLMSGLERTGQRWWPHLSGTLILEAEKQIYATGSKIKTRKALRRPRLIGTPVDSKNLPQKPAY
ncbi:class I SAM-dependent methyltransferase [Paremcibacter congregatus]|uniref:Methyltransferase type 11 n=1 Tax=Paremcibacter congregatus TaxID=2043170 RepID=A0A2G4YWF5_9PROT|nr:methyltransferase domain-containing protein [Paremcibacter congregatus]PHZ86668.1 methyltransferase type 11 [Paremcibacter congregatus]QDE26469.1 methyltransferase domain-containing protein [Paremcibacter congregatus]